MNVCAGHVQRFQDLALGQQVASEYLQACAGVIRTGYHGTGSTAASQAVRACRADRDVVAAGHQPGW
jgi:hypothetical protein